MKTLRRLPALLLALLCLAGCGGGPKRLTEPAKAPRAEARPLAAEDAAALAEFSLGLLKENWRGENALLSPLSALSALGMAANGAGGETLAQMEAVLGLPVEELNGTLAAWAAELPREKDCRVELANSVWVRDDGSFEADQDFLETAAGWYQAEVFASQFDAAAVRDINRWVEKNTRGMIPEILRELREETMLVLVNALALEAEWEEPYESHQVREGAFFHSEDQGKQNADLMHSTEALYMKDGNAQGFMKPYKGGRWAFAALLPDRGTLGDYLDSLTGERLHALLSEAEEREVYAAIPKFEKDYGAELANSLKALGMTDAFDMERADLSGFGVSKLGPLFISQVLHKTHISVDEKGTKAGAATAVLADAGADAPGMEEPVPRVYLDRPFLYMLVDRETNLPAFIGVVTAME
ncbi:serpin family protein [uncultured Oscillibacter sp.]|uniref:serpin family protein n=1 Tax=uncultured Oscillibacter sp. TaxID=876091 RepID=UPI002610FC82|nr:serpin family protein [uncultured Oscillibacter sp.]